MSTRNRPTPIINTVKNSRFAIVFAILGIYLSLSFLTRCALLVWSAKNIDFSALKLIRIFSMGLAYDLTIGLSSLMLLIIYLTLVPKKWIGTLIDRVLIYTYLTILLVILFFSLMAEFPFWEEFGVRFNFIAVDYLIYTYEVVSNINESYPLPLIISVLIGLVTLTFILLHKADYTRNTFSFKTPIRTRSVYALPVLLITFLLLIIVKNEQAEFSSNQVINELGKNGVFSFFAATRSNELDYDAFYPKIEEKQAYSQLKKNLLQTNQTYRSDAWDEINRLTAGGVESRPNIMLIVIESFSGDFLTAFGNKNNLTPFYDSLAEKSIFFTNLYATGTRTVRGMEALSLCTPPTPGNSIVRRPNNQHLFSIASILKQKKYHPYFIYGGDGYFDNMNNFFGGQGFDIVDRNRGNPLSDHIETQRYNIPTEEVSFENAWGICDEDLYKQAIKYADSTANSGTSFFQFIMTSSNHKPYTFPESTIDLPQGNRNAAVKYTDYALRKFITAAQRKPWFRNTVFVIVADHCASSAGKWEINIEKHHIPAIIYNLPLPPQRIERLSSQTDLMPTVFGYLNWTYQTSFYGKDINQMKPGEERAFIGNYRTLGLLKANLFTQIDDRRRVKQFTVLANHTLQTELKSPNKDLVSETIAYYQTASHRFKKGKMKE